MLEGDVSRFNASGSNQTRQQTDQQSPRNRPTDQPTDLQHVPLSESGSEGKCCHMVGIARLMTDRWTQEVNSDSGCHGDGSEVPAVQTGGHGALILWSTHQNKQKQTHFEYLTVTEYSSSHLDDLVQKNVFQDKTLLVFPVYLPDFPFIYEIH